MQFHLYACVESVLKGMRPDGSLGHLHPEAPHSLRLLRRRYRREIEDWYTHWWSWHRAEFARYLAVRRHVPWRNKHRRRWLWERLDAAYRAHRRLAAAVAAVVRAVVHDREVEVLPTTYLDRLC